MQDIVLMDTDPDCRTHLEYSNMRKTKTEEAIMNVREKTAMKCINIF